MTVTRPRDAVPRATDRRMAGRGVAAAVAAAVAVAAVAIVGDLSRKRSPPYRRRVSRP